MQLVLDTLLVEYPCHKICYGSENFRCGPQAEGESTVEVGLPFPAYPQVIRMDWHYAVRILYVILVPLPSFLTMLTASSTDAYRSEHKLGEIPSFTLPPVGWDRSTISCHLLTWWDFGASPRGLTWIWGFRWSGMGPSSLPATLSAVILSPTTCSFTSDEG